MHPCDRKSNGGCDQVCMKKGKGLTCSCKNGFKLAADKIICEKGLNNILMIAEQHVP